MFSHHTWWTSEFFGFASPTRRFIIHRSVLQFPWLLEPRNRSGRLFRNQFVTGARDSVTFEWIGPFSRLICTDSNRYLLTEQCDATRILMWINYVKSHKSRKNQIMSSILQFIFDPVRNVGFASIIHK